MNWVNASTPIFITALLTVPAALVLAAIGWRPAAARMSIVAVGLRAMFLPWWPAHHLTLAGPTPAVPILILVAIGVLAFTIRDGAHIPALVGRVALATDALAIVWITVAAAAQVGFREEDQGFWTMGAVLITADVTGWIALARLARTPPAPSATQSSPSRRGHRP